MTVSRHLGLWGSIGVFLVMVLAALTRAQQPAQGNQRGQPQQIQQTEGPAAQGASGRALLDKDHLRFQPEDAEEGGAIFGSANADGFYIVRNRFRAGNGSRPHYHTQDRWVTVIKGTWWTAEGDVYEPDKMVPIKQGGMMFHPAGLHHYDGAKAETGDVIVQIMGRGPVETVQTEVDARGNPVSRGRGAPAPGR